MNGTRAAYARAHQSRGRFVGLVLAAIVAVLVAACGVTGSGYGIDKGANRSHELTGVRDAAAILSHLTGGQIVIDTSRSS